MVPHPAGPSFPHVQVQPPTRPGGGPIALILLPTRELAQQVVQVAKALDRFDLKAIAIIGGLRHPVGPFIGAVVVTLMQTFAIDIIGAERFNTLIGLVFLLIVFISPDGILGLWERFKPQAGRDDWRSFKKAANKAEKKGRNA